MLHHEKLSKQLNIDLNKQNKQILLNIFKSKPNLVKEIILTNNPLRNYFGIDNSPISEEGLKRKFSIVSRKELEEPLRVELNCIVKVYEKERQSA